MGVFVFIAQKYIGKLSDKTINKEMTNEIPLLNQTFFVNNLALYSFKESFISLMIGIKIHFNNTNYLLYKCSKYLTYASALFGQ